MVSTVDEGTASPAQIPDVDVAGKTGTAQRGVPGEPPYGWFVSFAPADDADVAVAVMIEEAPGQRDRRRRARRPDRQGRDGGGAAVSTPTARPDSPSSERSRR